MRLQWHLEIPGPSLPQRRTMRKARLLCAPKKRGDLCAGASACRSAARRSRVHICRARQVCAPLIGSLFSPNYISPISMAKSGKFAARNDGLSWAKITFKVNSKLSSGKGGRRSRAGAPLERISSHQLFRLHHLSLARAPVQLPVPWPCGGSWRWLKFTRTPAKY